MAFKSELQIYLQPPHMGKATRQAPCAVSRDHIVNWKFSNPDRQIRDVKLLPPGGHSCETDSLYLQKPVEPTFWVNQHLVQLPDMTRHYPDRPPPMAKALQQCSSNPSEF
jgi:hypothetical protein